MHQDPILKAACSYPAARNTPCGRQWQRAAAEREEVVQQLRTLCSAIGFTAIADHHRCEGSASGLGAHTLVTVLLYRSCSIGQDARQHICHAFVSQDTAQCRHLQRSVLPFAGSSLESPTPLLPLSQIIQTSCVLAYPGAIAALLEASPLVEGETTADASVLLGAIDSLQAQKYGVLASSTACIHIRCACVDAAQARLCPWCTCMPAFMLCLHECAYRC